MIVENLLNLEKTIAKELFSDIKYPWEVLHKIHDFLINLGKTLPKEEFEEISENIWISKTAKVARSASIAGPCIIDSGAEIRHCAFIRGDVLVGKNAVVGNSCEIKNSILFNDSQVPHFNYIGDSILGTKSHFGAGAITSNVRSDKANIILRFENEKIQTNLRKFGAVVGDFVEIGCNAVLNPGTVLGRRCQIYPTAMVRGAIPEGSIVKNTGEIIKKR